MSLAQGRYREMPTSISPHLSPSLPISPVGLDQEMPGADFMNAAAIEAALASGEVDASRIDDAALRILTPLFGVGAFDINNTNTQRNNVSTPAHTPRSGIRIRALQPAPARQRTRMQPYPPALRCIHCVFLSAVLTRCSEDTRPSSRPEAGVLSA